MDIISRKKILHLTGEILTHLFTWLGLFLLNYLVITNYDVRISLVHQLITWSLFISFFYLNYFVLMPYFLFQKKTIVYIVLVVILLAGFTLLKNYFDDLQRHLVFEQFRKENPYFESMRKMPPGGRGRMHEPPGFRKHQLMSSYGLLLMFTASFSIRFFRKWKQDERLISDTEKERISAELSYLKQQVNPHFLFNSLNSIYSLSISNSSETTGAILKLSSILRYMLYGADKKVVSLQEELEIVKDYIELNKLRKNEKLTVSFSVEGDIEGYRIDPLLLIPLIENAFKYGADNVHDSFIHAKAIIQNEELQFHVENKIVNNPGMNGEESGIGIKNIRRRLELLYPDDYYFNIAQQGDVFKVFLQLKLKR